MTSPVTVGPHSSPARHSDAGANSEATTRGVDVSKLATVQRVMSLTTESFTPLRHTTRHVRNSTRLHKNLGQEINKMLEGVAKKLHSKSKGQHRRACPAACSRVFCKRLSCYGRIKGCSSRQPNNTAMDN
ncbi:unnamed protein product [Protopolystoma xenopodis]|uniref:Uncharacterized protein n=1 Tax=Protopolystoma xenopodis TaxID=117903 RepID=A0A448XJ74_9PLAT|nr:unnamed protein product [Protopolystoma xenopodis]